MRRLIGLSIKIGLRMMLFLSLTAWFVSRFYLCTAQVGRTFYTVAQSAVAVRYVTPNPSGFNFRAVPRDDGNTPYSEPPEENQLGWLGNTVGVSCESTTALLVFPRTVHQFAVRHSTLLALALTFNFVHMICYQRKQTAKRCDD